MVADIAANVVRLFVCHYRGEDQGAGQSAAQDGVGQGERRPWRSPVMGQDRSCRPGGVLPIPEINCCQIYQQGSRPICILKENGVLILIIGHQVNQYKGNDQGPFPPVPCHERKESQRQQHLQEKDKFVLYRNL